MEYMDRAVAVRRFRSAEPSDVEKSCSAQSGESTDQQHFIIILHSTWHMIYVLVVARPNITERSLGRQRRRPHAATQQQHDER